MFVAFALSMMVLSPITTDAPKCVWGFYNTKSRTYSAPINFSKQGDTVDINKTRPYTAMQLNLNPLEAALYG